MDLTILQTTTQEDSVRQTGMAATPLEADDDNNSPSHVRNNSKSLN